MREKVAGYYKTVKEKVAGYYKTVKEKVPAYFKTVKTKVQEGYWKVKQTAAKVVDSINVDNLKTAGSVILSVIPGVGDVKDWQEVITGVDLVTGEKLSLVDRGLTAICGLLPVVGGTVGRKAINLIGDSNLVKNITKFADEIATSLKSTAQDSADFIGKLIKEYTNVSSKSVTLGTGFGAIQGGLDNLRKALDNVKAADKLVDNTGKFIDNALESDYQKYLDSKAKQGKAPREREDWKEARDYFLNDSPMARGNAFNQKAGQLYDYNEVHLSNGKRLDSYDPVKGEIISRKATDLDSIELNTYEKYLKEMGDKYKAGTEIRSDKYPRIDGQQLRGKQILEIPASNKSFSKIQEYIDLAKNKYNIEIRFTEE